MSSLTSSQTEELVQFLSEVPLFSRLQDEDLRVLLPLVMRETIRAGRDVFRQSDDDKTLYIVYSGEIRLIHIDPTGVPNDVGRGASRTHAG